MEEEKKKINTSGRVSVTKVESKKVTNMVGTFLSGDSSAAMVSQYQPLKRNRKGYQYGGNLFK